MAHEHVKNVAVQKRREPIMPEQRFQCRALYTKLLRALLLICLLGSSISALSQAEHETQLSAIAEQINQLQRKLDSSMSAGQAELEALREQEQRLAALYGQRKELSQAISEKESELEQLKTALQAQVLEYRGQIENLALLVHSGYSTGGDNKLKMLLSQQNPYELGRLTNYYRYVGDARSERIRLLINETEKVTVMIDAYQSQRIELTNARRGLDANIAEVNIATEERSKTLLSLNAEIATTRQAIAIQQENKERLEVLLVGIDAARAEYISYVSPATGAGGFDKQRDKLVQPLGGAVSQAFGSVDPVTGLTRHGVFIQSAPGESVHAIFDGEVVFSDWLRGYGQLIILDHGGGYMSLYGHNRELFISIGDKVSPGQVISSAGVSGGLAQAGLYFEIRHNGDPVNPAGWLKG